MRKRNMVIAVFAIITMGLAATLGAQQSSQNLATAGVYGADADNFMDVNYYGDVELGKWFGYLGADWESLSLGYAAKLGGLYLGAYYEGNIFPKNSQSEKTLKTGWDEDLQKLTDTTEGVSYNNWGNTSSPSNSIDLLFGVAGMGFKLGFSEDYTFYNTPYNTNRQSWSNINNNVIDGTTYYQNDSISYEETLGFMAPSFYWGMNLDLGGSKVLAPRLGGKVYFWTDELTDEYYDDRTVYNDKTIGPETINKNGHNNGRMELYASAGFDFYLNESMYIGIDYYLGMHFYDQSFESAGREGSVKGFIDWTSYNTTTNYVDRTETESYVGINIEEKDYISHTIVPSIWKETSSRDDAKFGIKLSVPVRIENYTSNSYKDEWGTSETTYTDTNRSSENTKTTSEAHTAGLKTETSVLNITPIIAFGASYALIPGKFTVNAGVTVIPVSYRSENTTTATNGLNSLYSKTETGSGSSLYTSSEEKEVSIPSDPDWASSKRIYDRVDSSYEITGIRGNVAAGFTVNFNSNFALDVAFSSESSANVLFTVKY